MEINKRKVKNILVYDLIDTIDLYSAGELKENIYSEIEKGHYELVINLEKVNYIDSSGIGVLLSCLSKTKQKRGNLKLANLQPNVYNVIKISKFDRIFEIYDNVDKAIDSFSNQKPFVI